MAGDWIKIEHVTPDKPEVWQLAEILEIDPDCVIGKLVRLWAWADQQTYDGCTYLPDGLVDHVTRFQGFGQALRKVFWLSDEGIPHFDRHNGQSAKKRCLAERRKQRERSRDRHADVTEMSRTERDGNVTRDRDREEKNLRSNSEVKPTRDVSCFSETAVERCRKANRTLRAEKRPDRQLLARAAILADEVFTEDWFQQSIGGVTESKTERRFAKLTTCLRERAEAMFGTTDYDDIAKRISVPKKFYAAVWPNNGNADQS